MSTTREDMLGTWKMRSWTIEDLISEERRDALGPEPRGWITYTPGGRVMVLVVARERVRPAHLVPTEWEKIALYDSMFAYAGSFELDGTKVIHHIDTSWNEAWRGTSQVRYCEMRGDELKYVSAPARSPITGRDCVHTVVFERLA
ncbi:lipocalin-like domain-containing protein [Variovorax soli]|uniref:Lipocalin-like domain-containing protein n=1 Tax=Variovorax soli TaxID=376815 RepID=A0ABU1NME0_9BURK|nr:lipocalin-like domain-containing protein [Variovorax soli]MDR6539186.1 hypothetical protein [Variovorax soli]